MLQFESHGEAVRDQPTFDHYMDLKFFLGHLLNVEVDLVMADTVKPRLRSYISQEIMYV